MSFRRLMYCSSTTIFKSDRFEFEFDELVKQSRSNNDRDNITGCLVYSSLSFVQMLEGPDEQVLKTFARIQRDRRHKNVYLLQSESAHRRVFEHWSMLFHKSDCDQLSFKSGLAFRTMLQCDDLDRDSVLELMTSTVSAESRRLENVIRLNQPESSIPARQEMFKPMSQH